MESRFRQSRFPIAGSGRGIEPKTALMDEWVLQPTGTESAQITSAGPAEPRCRIDSLRPVNGPRASGLQRVLPEAKCNEKTCL